MHKQTVIEYAPDSEQAEQYRTLAQRVMENAAFTIPTPLEIDELESLALEYF
jgi:nitrogenase iron protein NifH